MHSRHSRYAHHGCWGSGLLHATLLFFQVHAYVHWLHLYIYIHAL